LQDVRSDAFPVSDLDKMSGWGRPWTQCPSSQQCAISDA